MKKGWILTSSMLFIMLLLIATVSAANLDQDILKELNENGEARVIVVLKDGSVQNNRGDAGDNKIASISDNPNQNTNKNANKNIKKVSNKNMPTNQYTNKDKLKILNERKEFIKNSQDDVIRNLKIKKISDNNNNNNNINRVQNTNQKSGQIKVDTNNDENFDFDLKHRYELINGFSGKVTKGGLEKLQNDNLVESIELDRTVSIQLDASVPLINADDVWDYTINNLNINGTGETVCIIDTGIDYTHAAFGSCNPVSYELNGTIEALGTVVESAHPYTNSFAYTWTITQAGYDNIAIHFVNMSLEAPGDAGGDATDRIYILDGDNNTLAVYKGDSTNVWTPYAQGDTIYIKLVTDDSANDYGFYIDQAINGTTNTTMNWTGCKVVNGWDFISSDNNPFDDNGHGTHVAGIVSSMDATYTGVAPGANLAIMKIFDSTGSNGYVSDINAA
ncbi:MAG: S8 family serine peptidase, partial [Candidatus Woesearchaeota archaeon]